MFIQTEILPDPAKLKFLPGREVLAQGALELRDGREAAAISPLAKRLFTIPRIATVAFGGDFITITKDGGEWDHLRPMVLGAIMDHFMSGQPVIVAPDAGSDGDGGIEGLVGQIREALRRVIDPELGYNIFDLGLIYDVTVGDGNAVHVTMTTTTVGCPATDYLLEGARDAAESVQGVTAVEVTLSYDPPWTPEMMTAEASAYLGIG